MVSKEQRRRDLARQKLVRQQQRREQDARRRRMAAIIAAAVAIVLVVVGITYIAVRGNDTDPIAQETTGTDPSVSVSQTPEPTEPPADGCTYVPDGEGGDVTPPPDGDPTEPAGDVATITTDQGVVTVALDFATAPCTVQSFATLAGQGYFDGTTCHRLTTSDTLSVLQCGDPTGTGSGGPGYSFADETNDEMTYERGTVAMANAGPDTNGSQFFLVYGDSQLPPDYTVFGTITGGLEALDAIGTAGVDGGGSDGAPATPVTITSVAVGAATPGTSEPTPTGTTP